ncbi:phytanoyl-CoA dioxygenase family protein [Arenimonas metalli]|nr:phytanoyl-CoA dioxygenase family protein [Arenimonas metalli]
MTERDAMPVPAFGDRDALERDGFVLLRGAIPAEAIPGLQATFDAGVLPNHDWPVPRGADWRHALLDTEPGVQAVCRLPAVLAAVGALIGERFFLAQVEGREPLPGGGHQGLHRDLSAQRPGDTALAIVFLDDYGPANGATRVVPGSHPLASFDFSDTSRAVQLSGRAGDILVFTADLVHAGSLNVTGGRRRSLLMSFFAAPVYESHLATAHLRNIRMPAAWFDPPASGPQRGATSTLSTG